MPLILLAAAATVLPIDKRALAYVLLVAGVFLAVIELGGLT